MIKERLTLWDFMGDHPTLVEDLTIAANDLGEKHHLHPYLKKYVNELREYDHFLCTEWHSPFHNPEVWTLEYNEKEHQFHYNNSCEKGEFRQALFSFGWMPVCLIPDCYSTDKEFGDLLNKICDKKLSYQDAVKSVYAWFSEKNTI